MRLRELETVVLQRDLPEHGLKKGDLGTVVMRQRSGAVEVEFLRASGQTQAVVSLETGDVRKASDHDVIAARPSESP
jgi:hypothetical protein